MIRRIQEDRPEAETDHGRSTLPGVQESENSAGTGVISGSISL